MSWVITGTSVPFDSDAWTYIRAVETVDGQILEQATRNAITNFVLGCKADGIWTALKASCILSGARTLSGALVPLVGTAPTNINFVSGDYNRKTGLVGNGSTKYINSKIADNSTPQNSNHLSAYASALPATGNTYAGVRNSTQPFNHLLSIGTRSRCADATLFATAVAGFAGLSRAASGTYSHRNNASSVQVTQPSSAPDSAEVFVFARNDGGSPVSHSDARLAFYSIGESLDLAKLDTRVTTLINALAAAIP
jgi:hypothetical protein